MILNHHQPHFHTPRACPKTVVAARAEAMSWKGLNARAFMPVSRAAGIRHVVYGGQGHGAGACASHYDRAQARP
jgi:hypothetical protein